MWHECPFTPLPLRPPFCDYHDPHEHVALPCLPLYPLYEKECLFELLFFFSESTSTNHRIKVMKNEDLAPGVQQGVFRKGA